MEMYARLRFLVERLVRNRRFKNLLIDRIAEDQLEHVKDKRMRIVKDIWETFMRSSSS